MRRTTVAPLAAAEHGFDLVLRAGVGSRCLPGHHLRGLVHEVEDGGRTGRSYMTTSAVCMVERGGQKAGVAGAGADEVDATDARVRAVGRHNLLRRRPELRLGQVEAEEGVDVGGAGGVRGVVRVLALLVRGRGGGGDGGDARRRARATREGSRRRETPVERGGPATARGRAGAMRVEGTRRSGRGDVRGAREHRGAHVERRKAGTVARARGSASASQARATTASGGRRLRRAKGGLGDIGRWGKNLGAGAC